MSARRSRCPAWPWMLCAILAAITVTAGHADARRRADQFLPRTPPRTVDREDFESAFLRPGVSLGALSEREYYRLPERRIYRTYPVYHPQSEPPNYLNWLREQDPEIIVADRVMSAEDWRIRGALVFEMPVHFERVRRDADPGDLEPDAETIPLAVDGIIPFSRYVIHERGVIEIGTGSCAMCHTHVTSNGTLVKGGPGSLGRAQTSLGAGDELACDGVFPMKVPDLTTVRAVRYLGTTAVLKHRGVGDLMRFSALEHGCARTAGPVGDEPVRARYSDDDLYAVALYLYSLEPPASPYREDVRAVRGAEVFAREGCQSCHPPPLYTSNQLSPATRDVDPSLPRLASPVGTDDRLALHSDRATGFYRIPSLLGLWYRGSFEHRGLVLQLEEWFDNKRLRPGFVSSGTPSHGRRDGAIDGHRFGLTLSDADRGALIAFLRTL